MWNSSDEDRFRASVVLDAALDDDGGAEGYLVGEENHGIEYIFTMMNNARLAIGVQGVGVAAGDPSRLGGQLHALDHPAAAHHDGGVLDRIAAVSGRDGGVGDGEILRGERPGKRSGSTGEEERKFLHFTSPSPGWPSSKSLTGRRFLSIASNISAPSTQTFSGRE